MDSEEATVRVAARIRPVEQPSYQATAISFVDSTVAVASDAGTEKTDVECILVETSDAKSAEASQEQVFQSLGQPIIQGAIAEGISQGLLVYGASGSGKTFTVIGTKEAPGLFPRLLGSLLQPDGVVDKEVGETRIWLLP